MPAAAPVIRAVVFDVGETLVSESRAWLAWAAYLGVPPLTFLASLGATIARGGDHREPFSLFRPGFGPADVIDARGSGAVDDAPRLEDLYPDAVAGLRAVAAAGYRVGIAGNQPGAHEALFRSLGVPLDLVTSSAELGVEKPAPAFFERIASALELPPASIAYVGDRVDNDVRPAAAAGMRAILVRRGAWAWIQAGRGAVPEAFAIVEDLETLPEVLAGLG